MAVNKIRKNFIFDNLLKIFNIERKDLNILYKDTIDCNFIYKNIIISLEVSSDFRDYPYRYINFFGKLITNNFYVDKIKFSRLFAYYDNGVYTTTATEEELIKYFSIFKNYIDNKKIFFTFHTLDLKKRLFYHLGNIKEIPRLIDFQYDHRYYFNEKEVERFERILKKRKNDNIIEFE